MLNSITGEIAFQNGLVFVPHAKAHFEDFKSQHSLPVNGWMLLGYGTRVSDFGEFEVEAVCDEFLHVHIVVLTHQHHFYNSTTPDDSERLVFHEAVIEKDLLGRKEFAWGTATTETDTASNKSRLVIIYTPSSNVPAKDAVALLSLVEHKAQTQ